MSHQSFEHDGRGVSLSSRVLLVLDDLGVKAAEATPIPGLPKVVSRRVGLSVGRTRKLLGSLERHGLLYVKRPRPSSHQRGGQRRGGPGRGRANAYSLTPQGEARLRRLLAKLAKTKPVCPDRVQDAKTFTDSRKSDSLREWITQVPTEDKALGNATAVVSAGRIAEQEAAGALKSSAVSEQSVQTRNERTSEKERGFIPVTVGKPIPMKEERKHGQASHPPTLSRTNDRSQRVPYGWDYDYRPRPKRMAEDSQTFEARLREKLRAAGLLDDEPAGTRP